MSEVQIEEVELRRLQTSESLLNEIRAKQEAVSKLKTIYADKKDASLAAKKNYDEGTSALLELIAQKEATDRPLPLFDKLGEQSPPVEPITDGWENVPIDALGLTKGLLAKLRDAGVKTMGALEARRSEHGRCLGIDGIADAKAEKVNDAADKWLRENRDKALFDSAAAVPADAPRGAKLLVEVVALGLTFKVGTILPLSDTMEDGRLVLKVGEDQVFSVQPGEAALVAVKERPVKVEIVAPVPGCDNESDKLNPGYVAEVASWQEESPIVVSGAGRQVVLGPEEWITSELGLVEV